MLAQFLASIALLTPDLFGSSVARISDLDGDGIADIVVADASPPLRDGSWHGATVFSGASGGQLFKFGLDLVPGSFDRAIATGFDYDADGVNDFALLGVQPHSALRSMVAIHIYSVGKRRLAKVLELPTLVDDSGVQFLGVADIDMDGVPDFAIDGRVWRSVRETKRYGRMFFSGVDGCLIREWKSGVLLGVRGGDAPCASLVLTKNLDAGLGRLSLRDLASGSIQAELVGTEGFVGEARFVEDANGDGLRDVLTIRGFETGVSSVIHVVVHDSHDGEILWEREIESAHPVSLLTAIGVGDVDLDGLADIAVLSWQRFATCSSLEVFSLASDVSLMRACQADEDLPPMFGISVCGLGDVDGDGVGDIAVGSCDPTAEALIAGRCEVYSGRLGEVLYATGTPERE